MGHPVLGRRAGREDWGPHRGQGPGQHGAGACGVQRRVQGRWVCCDGFEGSRPVLCRRRTALAAPPSEGGAGGRAHPDKR